ncbi:hypothetical protein RHGRI_022257 [Rhododendron griersonianum]|uniref:Defensin-like protein n=1 Tax=Rhododendron griersonianum TaxID=479676 RepID=A0AAV6IYX5_9ERIC|nr:hypothetical protein RHGRI_022257 [Rhododendron griersonianum]
MKNLSPFVVLVLLLFISLCSEMRMWQACELQIYFDNPPFCNETTCHQLCQQKKGRYAKGRCKIIDTCFCEYPC